MKRNYFHSKELSKFLWQTRSGNLFPPTGTITRFVVLYRSAMHLTLKYSPFGQKCLCLRYNKWRSLPTECFVLLPSDMSSALRLVMRLGKFLKLLSRFQKKFFILIFPIVTRVRIKIALNNNNFYLFNKAKYIQNRKELLKNL